MIDFPQTGILDNFNRPFELPLRAPWSAGNGFYINYDIAFPYIAGNSGATWQLLYGNNVEVYFTVLQFAPASIYLRYAAALSQGYFLTITATAITINRRDPGYIDTVLESFAYTYTWLDKIGFRIYGSNLKAYLYTAGAWTEIISLRDTHYISNNFPNIFTGDLSLIIDDFGGGTYIPTNNYPIANLKKGLISGFHVFLNQYIKSKLQSFDPLRLPDGTVY